ncbi:MAG: hypothetical protein QOE37_1382 [Microbacteriaceae bacterium]|jgi:uncharacterized protein with FMN-binding domain|nr:hypothetical protein [Microbacteriaceae bacterium]
MVGMIRPAGVVALALAALGGLAGCASESAAGAPAPGATVKGPIRDGRYTETGAYQTPGGPEALTVSVTVADGRLTAVAVHGTGRTANAVHYQAAFASGIAAVVVGRPLNGLAVGAVAGSSLTPAGFDSALDRIRADATAPR